MGGGNLSVIYADTLFLVNFSLDFLALYISGRSLATPIYPLRLAAAAAIGAGYATLSVIFTLPGIPGFIVFAAFALIMCFIAFRQNVIRSSVVFTATSMGLGGMISVLCRLLRISGLKLQGQSDAPVLLLFAGISGILSLAYTRLRRAARREVEVLVEFHGTRKLRLLSDSGNLLVEPISGIPVVIVKPSALGLSSALSPGNLPEGMKIRVIPSESVNGSGLLYGFLSTIFIGKNETKAVIATADADFSGCDGIIPETLL